MKVGILTHYDVNNQGAQLQMTAMAKKLESITYGEILTKGLRVIDSTAAALSNDNRMPTLVFGLDDPDNIYRAVMGEKLGTVITA